MKTYNIPLRKEVMKVPKYKRANKAIRALRKFLLRHLKEDVLIGGSLNQKVLEHGRKNVPHHVQVEIRTVKRKDEDVLIAEIPGAPVEKVVVEEKGKLAKVKDKIIGKKEETPKEEEKKEKDKVIKEKSKDLSDKKHKPKLKQGKLSTAPSKPEERKDIVNKSEKPSKETKLSKK